MKWLKEEANEKAATTPETVRVQIMNGLIADRLASLEKQKEEAAKLPDKEESTVTLDLITDRNRWLEEQQKKASELPKKEHCHDQQQSDSRAFELID